MRNIVRFTIMVMLLSLALGVASAQDDLCFVEPEVMTTADGVEFVRTPDACFENLPDWDYEPHYVEIDGLRQAYVDVGSGESGETILLLHGQPSWSYLYRKMIPVLADAGHRVIAMDHVGMGRSDKPVDPDYYTYLGHVERLETFIQELELEQGNLTIFVQDWGSLIGLQVVGTNPDWFDRLVVSNGFLPTFEEGTTPFPLPDNPLITRNLFHRAILGLPAQQELIDWEAEEPNLGVESELNYFSLWIDYARNDERFRPEVMVEAQTYYDISDEEEAAYAAPFPTRITMGGVRAFPGLINQLPGVTDSGWAGLVGFDKPFLTIWGDNDGGNLGNPTVQQTLLDNIPGSVGWDHVRLEEASHFLQDDQGEEIARRVNEFIAQTSEPSAAQSGERADLYDTIVAFEHFDAERTHRFQGAEFQGVFDGENTVIQQAFSGVFPSPYNIVTREADELFVYGGGYGDQPDSTGAFVARLDAATYAEVWRTVLINTDETGDWNYPGVVSVLANGDLYVIFGYQIARMNAETGEVIQQEMLPVIAPARDTSYNGFTVLRDGTIIAKTVSRETGCELQGFSAFLQCPNPQNVPTSLMVAIDPETLDVIAQTPVAEPAFGRITSTRYNGVDYIYLAGFDNLFRYTFNDDNTFMFDEDWGFVPYRMEGQTGGTAIAVMNDWIVVQTNSTPSPTPLSVVVASQSDSTITYRLDPFADSPNPISFIPSMLTVDPENNRIYTQDAGAGRVAALEFDPEHGLTVAWMVEQTTLHFTTLVGPQSARVLVATDVPGFSLRALQNGETQMENVVWRDAETGMELARSGDLPPMTSGVLVTPGYNGRFYYLGLAGDIFELYPQQSITQDDSNLVYLEGFYDTLFPSERANLNGSKAVPEGGFPRGTTVDDVAVEVIEMPYPVLLYTREPDEIFVFGGTPLIIEDYVSLADGLPAGRNQASPYLAKYNTVSGEITYLDLDRGRGLPYLGGALVHANGYVYVVSQVHLYKVEPETMTIEESVALPRVGPTTIYNGLATSSTGELILKSLTPNGGMQKIVLVDPDTLEATFELDCECASPRLTVFPLENGEEYLYHLNQEQTFRWLIEPGSLTLDEDWIVNFDPTGLGVGNNDEPTSPVIVGDIVYYTTNTNTDATTPMRVFWQDINATYTPDMPSLTGPLLFEGIADIAGWSFTGLAGDDATGVLFANDQLNGLFMGFRLTEDGEIERLWEREITTAQTTTSSGTGMIYVADYADEVLNLVVLDVLTGEELLRIPTPAVRSSIGSIIFTENGDVYLAANEPGQDTGKLIRFYIPAE